MNLSRKKIIIIFVVILLLMFFTVLIENLRPVAPEQTQTISLITPTNSLTNIFPTSPITLTFTSSPLLSNCSITSQSNEFFPLYKTSIEGNDLIISSDSSWPAGQLMKFLVSCKDYSATVNVSTQSLQSMTEDDQFKVNAKDEVSTALKRRDFLNTHQYIESFPLVRDSYMVMLLEVPNMVMYVSPKSGSFTKEQQDQIEKKERSEVKKLGVPDEIPFTFTPPTNK